MDKGVDMAGYNIPNFWMLQKVIKWALLAEKIIDKKNLNKNS